MTYRTYLLSCIILFTVSLQNVSHSNVNIIRDAEIEYYLRSLCAPLFKVAGLNKDDIGIYIVSGRDINAFVTNGKNIFVFTGLIAFSDNTDSILGVLSHEVGHITRGHLIRFLSNGDEIRRGAIIGYTLAALATLAGGGYYAANSGLAIAAITAQIQQRSSIAHIRSHEEEADGAAFQYLRMMHRSPIGLYDVMYYFDNMLRKNISGPIDKYVQTHPIPEDRLERIKNYTDKVNYGIQRDLRIEDLHRRVKAKIIGFLGKNYTHFNERDSGKPYIKTIKNDKFYEDYERIHSLWNQKKYNESIALIDKWISVRQDDVFLHEAKANILVEIQKNKDAILEYRKSIALMKNYPMLDRIQIEYELAKAMSTLDDRDSINESIGIMLVFADYEKDNPEPHRYLSQLYNKVGNYASSYLHLAEESVILGDCIKAIEYANKSTGLIKSSDKKKGASNVEIVASDIISYCNLSMKDNARFQK